MSPSFVHLVGELAADMCHSLTGGANANDDDDEDEEEDQGDGGRAARDRKKKKQASRAKRLENLKKDIVRAAGGPLTSDR